MGQGCGEREDVRVIERGAALLGASVLGVKTGGGTRGRALPEVKVPGGDVVT